MVVGIFVLATFLASRLIAHSDGPFFVLAGGPLRSGELVELADLDWQALDALSELEMEIVGEASSLTLWFSVYRDVPYVACDLDCEDGELSRWPQQIARDPRVVLRIDGKRIPGRLVLLPHDSAEYQAAKAVRDRKYSGQGGLFAATQTAAHGAVVEVGEVLTGRANRAEPGDRLFRVDPRALDES